MGTFSVEVEVAKPYGSEFQSIGALVDTRATYCVLPGDVLERVGASIEESRTFELADNRIVELPFGYVSLRLEGKQIIAPVVFGPVGVSPLLGATALEISGFAVDPINQRLVPVNALLKTGFDGGISNGAAENGIS